MAIAVDVAKDPKAIKSTGHLLWSGCRGWYSLLSADKKGNRDGRGCPNDGGSHAPVLLHSNV